MSVSSRTVVFLVFAIMSAASLNAIGVVEQSKAFNDQIHEYRGLQLANSLDTFSLYEEGEMEKSFNQNYSIVIDDGTLSFSALDRESVEIELADKTENYLSAGSGDIDINARTICVEKIHEGDSNQLEIEEGVCS